jgi:hypothetical protein
MIHQVCLIDTLTHSIERIFTLFLSQTIPPRIVFFFVGMYMKGMDCGYMALHNAIGDGEDYQKMRHVNRFEVIDDSGRAYTKYFEVGEGIQYVLQDDDRTLKVFIDKAR